jgi:CRP-like cAMP-binding protein
MIEKIFKKGEVIFRTGDENYFLYKVISGKIISIFISGSKVTPVYLTTAGGFAGTLTFFLTSPPTVYAIAEEDTKVIIFDQEDLKTNFPGWLISLAKTLAEKTRTQILQIVERGIKKNMPGMLKPLSIEEQRRYLIILNLIKT